MFKESEHQNPLTGLLSKKQSKGAWLIPMVLAAIFILAVLVISILVVCFEATYAEKFFPGSHIGAINLSGLTRDEAFRQLDAAAGRINQETIRVNFYLAGRQQSVDLVESLNPDSASSIFDYDVHKTVFDSWQIGRNNSWLNNLLTQWSIWRGHRPFAASIKFDEEYLKKTIRDQIGNNEIQPQNAKPKIACIGTVCSVSVVAEKKGLVFDYNKAISNWENGLAIFAINPIELQSDSVEPEVTGADGQLMLSSLSVIFNSSATPFFAYQADRWPLSKKTLAPLVEFDRIDGKVEIAINHDLFVKWFTENIGKNIDMPAQNAKVEIVDGQVTGLTVQQGGKMADVDRAYTELNSWIRSGNLGNQEIAITVVDIQPEVAMNDVENLGITELIGVGQSDFAGSPVNRIKNIKNGAAKLHGRLIKPGDEFSVMQSLLPVDGGNGYFPELVIKENKTMPEFGGGLCQVGTTMFRAALSSGLPILERQNHSYNVGYYLENGLPGVDATIYDPHPDLKFKNDTGNYILVQTIISGTKLSFEFWGKKDGRVAARTAPKVWGVKNPPPGKLIQTTDLPVGQKKCTEKAHKGISASFNYIVNYADGHAATTTFTSIYKPWQEVCLIGVAATSTVASVNP